MRCAKCHSTENKVIDSRIAKDGSSIRRRRECTECGYRFTTVEEILHENVFVLKRDGTREPLDRNKMASGIRKACEKRPVDLEQIDLIVTEALEELEKAFSFEIPAEAMGEKIMEKLRPIDQVAYVRYASVYKDFRDVSEFVSEIDQLQVGAEPRLNVPFS